MRRLILWLLAGICSIAITVAMFFPAAWLAGLVEYQTAGRLTLGDAHGTLWRGSAFFGAAPGANDPVTPLLPGRFSWKLSPWVLLGMLDITLENAEALPKPLSVSGNWRQWQASPGAVLVPAERLAALGAPLNTVQPSGQMRLSWGALQFRLLDDQVEIDGNMNLEISELASRLSPVKPLGSYSVACDWHGKNAAIVLKTLRGPLLLDGNGMLDDGRLQFSGKATAEAGHEEKLANFMNLLGQRRREGDKDIITLEFK